MKEQTKEPWIEYSRERFEFFIESLIDTFSDEKVRDDEDSILSLSLSMFNNVLLTMHELLESKTPAGAILFSNMIASMDEAAERAIYLASGYIPEDEMDLMASLEMDDARNEFLQQIKGTSEYWKKQANSIEDACDGVAFSIMALIDGTSCDYYTPLELIAKSPTYGTHNIAGSLHDNYYKTELEEEDEESK